METTLNKYNHSGKLLYSCQMKNNTKHGEEKYWYFQDCLESITQYKFGVLHGYQIIYYKNGKIKRISKYVAGEKSGIDIIYSERGNLNVLNFREN